MGIILTKHGEIEQLAKIFKKSIVTVRSALRERTKTDLAKRIRKAALERGGIEQNAVQLENIRECDCDKRNDQTGEQ